MTACRATDNGYVCNKSADHVGEHAARNQFAFDGPILHRWPNAPTAAPDHGPLAATLSDRTLDKVLSRPAYVPRETPSLAELDRQEARARVLDAAFIYEDASRGRDVEAEIEARDAFFARVRECRKVVQS